jgi:hypothetical protein
VRIDDNIIRNKITKLVVNFRDHEIYVTRIAIGLVI